ncbi:hypothetical protein H6F67_20525 [Microcoleus sp. FACHB-1515]|uniref:DUF6825 family protein n=1 Tax=Cyanophyceae TaxID=3028117 RepID=UPI0016820D88|nr:hypothetical protein [Microcoleus sp. FACHB-1515]MBD2092239.1 hypothetical protein [Microcoleus sp. FACHB-1515]
MSNSNPLIHAFFVGRAFAEALGEQVEIAVTDALSELGKFDAEQRERLRQFTEQVLERARQEEELAMHGRTATTVVATEGSEDVQATIDDLRAEIATLRVEIQRHRSASL